ncbi:hypothetical protein AB4097_01750 [Microvirga sp. 2MCAF35]|uniref:hypothetical protein n=1 Tax=Microvirga sp. 2MCAF35 TaxID=3232987 RepID=UPI003F9A28B3
MEDALELNRVKPPRESWRGKLLDTLVIYLLPMIYLTGDFIGGGLVWLYYPLTFSTCVVGAMIAYALPRFLSDETSQQIVSGVLIVTGIGYYLVGIALLLPSLFAFAMFGRYGFAAVVFSLVPLLAGHRLLLRSKAIRLLEGQSRKHLITGINLALVTIAGAMTIELIGDGLRHNDLVSSDRRRVLRALSSESWYSPRDVFGHRSPQASAICSEMELSYLNDKEIREAIEAALKLSSGDTIDKKCEKYLYQ